MYRIIHICGCPKFTYVFFCLKTSSSVFKQDADIRYISKHYFCIISWRVFSSRLIEYRKSSPKYLFLNIYSCVKFNSFSNSSFSNSKLFQLAMHHQKNVKLSVGCSAFFLFRLLSPGKFVVEIYKRFYEYLKCFFLSIHYAYPSKYINISTRTIIFKIIFWKKTTPWISYLKYSLV